MPAITHEDVPNGLNDPGAPKPAETAYHRTKRVRRPIVGSLELSSNRRASTLAVNTGGVTPRIDNALVRQHGSARTGYRTLSASYPLSAMWGARAGAADGYRP
jgi:hypothetical protein